MLTKRSLIAGATLAVLFAAAPARAQEKLNIVASFSILGDLVKNVGGDRVDVSTLVGPNGDVHVFEPSPADARKVANANVVVVNGLGLEGWLDRLIAASGTKARIIVATKGIKPREAARGHDRVRPARLAIGRKRDDLCRQYPHGLIAADPANKAIYESNAAAYLIELAELDRDIRAAIAKIPPDRRRVVTSHRAFNYFEDAYGIKFDAPQGVSDDAEPSAKDLAAIIEKIRQQKNKNLFLENVADPVVLKRIANESGAAIGGILYSDALTARGRPGADLHRSHAPQRDNARRCSGQVKHDATHRGGHIASATTHVDARNHVLAKCNSITLHCCSCGFCGFA